ncbi:MAG: DUF6285 domain-containing protein [Pseudomonadota bacterium]
MRDRPQGHELLAIAAQTFREQLLPALPEEKKYVAMMLLNALSIAERQLANGEAALQAEAEALEALLGMSTDEGAAINARLAVLDRTLAQRIRKGALDDDRAAQQLLWAITLQKVRESSPRYLKAEGLE